MPINFGPGDLYVQLYSSSPAPKRDYHGLTITSKYVILNSWDISHGPHVFPRKMRTPLEELYDDSQLQKDIAHLFGSHVLDYALQLASDKKSLQTLPNKVFLKILRLLAANDILHLGQTSKIFFEICNSNQIWKIIYKKKLKKGLTNQELLQSEKMSWKYLLKKKIMEKVIKIKNAEKKPAKFPKPTQDVLNSIAKYSKPVVYKRRPPPPSHMLPKDSLDIELKMLDYEKNKTKILGSNKAASTPLFTKKPPQTKNPLISFSSPQSWTNAILNAPTPITYSKTQKTASTTPFRSNDPKAMKKVSSPNLTQKTATTKETAPKKDLKVKSESDITKPKSGQQKTKTKM